MKWLEEEVGIDFERAYEFIRIWEGYKMCADSAHISSIGKSILLKSSQKDVPESARQEIVNRHEAGEKITLALSDEIIERHKVSYIALYSGDTIATSTPTVGVIGPQRRLLALYSEDTIATDIILELY